MKRFLFICYLHDLVWINEQVKSGRFNNKQEVLRYAVKLLRKEG